MHVPCQFYFLITDLKPCPRNLNPGMGLEVKYISSVLFSAIEITIYNPNSRTLVRTRFLIFFPNVSMSIKINGLGVCELKSLFFRPFPGPSVPTPCPASLYTSPSLFTLPQPLPAPPVAKYKKPP
jgi:hypothetical protein